MRRVAVALAVMLAACGGGTKSTTTSATSSSSSSSPSTTALTGFGTQRVSTPSPDDEFSTQLVNVRAGDHGQFVRVVFEFDKGVSPYVVEFASPPFIQDGSGTEVHVPGDAFLAVRLDQTYAHDDEGKSAAPVAIAFSTNGTLREVRRLGDFEGVVHYVLGLGTARPFRVAKLLGPPRLVVDVAV